MARILVIDDEPTARILARCALEDAGHNVVEAEDGEDGLAMYRCQPADVIVTDIIMPGKEGFELIRELRREFPDARIIAMSGGGPFDSGKLLNMAESFGVNATFTKPIDPTALQKAVNNLLANETDSC